MIEIGNLTKRFGNLTAIEDISLNVSESSIYGLIGFNGAGKTTLLKTAAGIYQPDAGEVLFDGKNTYDNGEARSELFFVPDDVYLPRTATLMKLRDLYKGYYPNFSDKVFNNMVDAMGLDPKKNIRAFSKGMQRQSEVIMAMASMPKYLLLDELFDGIDPQKRAMCKKILLEYMAETGCSIIMSSHNLKELADICDNIALINGKRVVMDVSVDDVSAAYMKYRLIFNDEQSASGLYRIPNRGVTVDGRLATIIVASDIDESAFAHLNPLHIEGIHLSLEEVFLNEMEEKEYDVSKIFSE